MARTLYLFVPFQKKDRTWRDSRNLRNLKMQCAVIKLLQIQGFMSNISQTLDFSCHFHSFLRLVSNVCPGFEPCWAVGDKELFAFLHWPGFDCGISYHAMNLNGFGCSFQKQKSKLKNSEAGFPLTRWHWLAFPLCLKVQKRPTNLRPCSRRCSHAKSVLGSWEMSEKSCLTLRVAISVRCRELQERQDRTWIYKETIWCVIMMYIL